VQFRKDFEPLVEATSRRCISYIYNFVRIHQTLKMSPAMAAGVTKRLWEIGDIVDMLEAWEQSGCARG